MKEFFWCFGLGCLVGLAVASIFVEIEKLHEDPMSEDVAKSCHIVKHSDTDGFSYWSCEKNSER